MKVIRTLVLTIMFFYVVMCCKKNDTTGPHDGIVNIIEVTCPQIDIPWPSLADSPWPMWRHDPQHTGRSPYQGPQDGEYAWAANPHPVYELTTTVLIGPDGTLYYHIAGHNGQYLVALNPNGSEKWSYQFDEGVEPAGRAPVITADGTLWVGCDDLYLYAINPDGTLKDKFYVGVHIYNLTIGIDGIFYFVTHESGPLDGTLYSVNQDGSINWSLKLDNGFSYAGTPVFSPDGFTLYVSGGLEGLYAISTDGELQWRVRDIGETVWCRIVDNQGNIYVIPGRQLMAGLIISYNPDGSVRWTYPGAHPSSHNALTMDHNGFLYAVDYKEDCLISLDYFGNLRWKCPFPERYVYSDLTCDSEGSVYLINSTSQPSVFAVSSEGEIKWTLSFPQGPITTDSEPTIGVDGHLYITADYMMQIFSIN
jgi:outer membrane protein assembly factor BamB